MQIAPPSQAIGNPKQLLELVSHMLTTNQPLLAEVDGFGSKHGPVDSKVILDRYRRTVETIRQKEGAGLTFTFSADGLEQDVRKYAEECKRYGIHGGLAGLVEENLNGYLELITQGCGQVHITPDLLAERMALLENDKKPIEWDDVVLRCYLSASKGDSRRLFGVNELFGRKGPRELRVKYTLPGNLDPASVAEKAKSSTNMSKATSTGGELKTGAKTALTQFNSMKDTKEYNDWRNGTFRASLDKIKPDLYSLKQAASSYFAMALSTQYIQQEVSKNTDRKDFSGQFELDLRKTNEKFLRRAVLQGILADALRTKGIDLNLIKVVTPYQLYDQGKNLLYLEFDDQDQDPAIDDDDPTIVRRGNLEDDMRDFQNDLLLRETAMPRFACMVYLAYKGNTKEPIRNWLAK